MHASEYGEVFEGVIAGLDSKSADEILRLVDGNRDPCAYVLADLNPKVFVRMALARPAWVRPAGRRQQHLFDWFCTAIYNEAGWSAYHRLADAHPQHFAEFISSLDSATAEQILSVCNKNSNLSSVAMMFQKHSAMHGDPWFLAKKELRLQNVPNKEQCKPKKQEAYRTQLSGNFVRDLHSTKISRFCIALYKFIVLLSVSCQL
jgi:hypothetical protein